MAKYCYKCKKKIGVFSAAFHIGSHVFCRDCADDISQMSSINKDLKENQVVFGQKKVLYSGLIVKNGVKTPLGEITTKEDIESNLRKINNLPSNINTKIFEVPQFEIFFENNIPYYITQKDSTKKELPKNNLGKYYDPVMDTEAYRLVIDDVKKIAHDKHNADIVVIPIGGCAFSAASDYWDAESQALYQKYGICCFSNPAPLNHYSWL